jgi:hypothetical protein
MHLPEHVADLIQAVLGRQPGPRQQPVVVGATLAIHQDELHGGEGASWPEQVSHQHGLAEPG